MRSRCGLTIDTPLPNLGPVCYVAWSGARRVFLSTSGRNYGDVFTPPGRPLTHRRPWTNYKDTEVLDRIDRILSCELGLLLNFGARKVAVKRKVKVD